MMSGSSIPLIYLTNFLYAAALGGAVFAGREPLQKMLLGQGSQVTASKTKKFAVIQDREYLSIGLAVAIAVFCALSIVGVNGVVAILSAMVAFVLIPEQIRRRRRVKFEQDFDHSLVDSLTTISSSLRAGLTLKDSLHVAARNSQPVFAEEASTALKEYRFGKPFDAALHGIRTRVRTQNANLAFGAMIIGNQLGGNLPTVLQRIVTTIRERGRVEGKLKSLTAQGRTQALLLCSAPPLLYVLMYMWDARKVALLTETFPGQILLCLAILLEVLGIIVTRKVMQLDV